MVEEITEISYYITVISLTCFNMCRWNCACSFTHSHAEHADLVFSTFCGLLFADTSSYCNLSVRPSFRFILPSFPNSVTFCVIPFLWILWFCPTKYPAKIHHVNLKIKGKVWMPSASLLNEADIYCFSRWQYSEKWFTLKYCYILLEKAS